ncbi:hypothetical protein O181_102559 [Austropuccinia psidii MF-1]|uniref:Integrase catalytic domain-containing protein n=1 Tax=Austropuccinia psidii MF-1 TaxID=1389203 RepID=A0A9Q3JIR5_9BASI|nr:hypothetical protein [Austropuccinia psidii MF-1]
MILADLIGPLPLSIDKKRYALIIQDSFSRLTAFIPLHDKTGARHHLKTWMLQFMNTMKITIKALRTDNGAEFKNNAMDEFLKEKGIVHEYSMPYEHHQNGKVERTNRTLSEIARTSLIAAGLPVTIWPWAFKHAVWIFNRTLHSDERKTPYEIISGTKPSLALLCVFGAKSYVHNHLFKKDMSARGIEGYDLGVAPDSKGWLFWMPSKNSIVKSASAKIDELTFYSKSKISTIQAMHIFDDSMIKEINLQDKMVSSLNSNCKLSNVIPTTYKEAFDSGDGDKWGSAINEELSSKHDEKVFTTVNLKEALRIVPRESILSSKWVFVKKEKPERYKARLVARGFRQIQGINFEKTFAPTPTFNSLRLLFSNAILMKWEIRTLDVKVAFLHSFIDKPVYIWPPQGLSVSKHHVIKLEKALYGTKQAARCWWLHLKQILLKIGFIANKEDPSTYSFQSEEGMAMLWIHVDDGAITASSNKLMKYLVSQLNNKLKIKWDEEINKIVGLTIEKGIKGYKFHQQDLIEKLIHFNSSNITALSPLPHNCQLESHKETQSDKDYLKRIGILLYIAQGSCPDIAYGVNYLARFSMCATTTHWNALEHLIAYLRRTKDLGILISTKNAENKLTCYVDANWGGEGNRSTHGYLLMHGKNPIAWQSKRQVIVASSTAQAEYVALSFAAKECLWISHLFASITRNLIPYMLSNNKKAIGIPNDSLSRKQTRHLIREFNLINEYIVHGKIHLDWISTNFQLADIMTKSIGSIKTRQFTNIVNYN